jgi:multimeric flavodoxin WrbA
MIKILGVSASLRNARFGAGRKELINDIKRLGDRDALKDYLSTQTQILLKEFFEVGRTEGQPFTELYDRLRRARGDRGLSNSEAELAAGLWGAHQEGAEIAHCGLASHFPMSNRDRNLAELRRLVLWADAILLAGPVYFGDRGSPAQSFFEFLHADEDCRRHVVGKVYAGLTVGAKRNGGQETTLIYQIVDATNLGMLAVGNDSETTAQYGGTAVAGDIGIFPNDEYGLTTAISTGRRIAHAAQQINKGGARELKDDLRVGIWLLQDTADNKGRTYIEDLCATLSRRVSGVSFDLVDMTMDTIHRCIACDICPTDVGVPAEYRCIINHRADSLKKRHNELISADAILLAAYSPRDRTRINSVYQTFIERTRYLWRDDYLLGDRLTAPLVISEVGANQNFHIRMLTSAIRHHVILHHPLIGFEFEGNILNDGDLVSAGASFCNMAKIATVGRLLADRHSTGHLYNPVGYVVSREKQRTDIGMGRTKSAHRVRDEEHSAARRLRLA